ncbi:MAG: DUF4328 domain-containing protein [Pirellulales bacterium]
MGPQIYIGANNQAYGPYEFAHVQAGVRRGEITPQHMLSYDGRQWFPAQSIWPQLLGQAGFGPMMPQQSQPATAAPSRPAPAHPHAPQGRAIAQAQPVLQAQAVATPAQSVSQGVALAAETVDPEASVYSPWPGRIVMTLFSVVFLFMAAVILTFLIMKLPGMADMIRGSRYPRLMESAAIPMQFLKAGALVAVSIWAYFAARDLALRNVAPPPPSPGWACGWFYIPLANLFMPVGVLQKLWKSSDWTARGVARRPTSTMLIPVWWYGLVVCFAAQSSAVASQVYFRWNKEAAIDVLMKRGSALDRMLFEIWPTYIKAAPTLFVVEAVAWGVGLMLFAMFTGRVRTRVEMG